jgi:hypothetical protein
MLGEILVHDSVRVMIVIALYHSPGQYNSGLTDPRVMATIEWILGTVQLCLGTRCRGYGP